MAIFGSRTLDTQIARPSEEPWVRWTRTGGRAHAFVDVPAGSRVLLDVDQARLDVASGRCGEATVVVSGNGRPEVIGGVRRVGPAVISFDLR